MKEIKLPKLDNNSEIAIISWKVNNHDRVNIGQVICDIETVKAVEEVKTEHEGIIFIDPKYLTEAPFNTPIAFICDNEEEFSKLDKN